MVEKEVLAIRLTNQYLTHPYIDSVEKLVHWFGAVQSQDFAGAIWALGQRTRQASNEAIEDAFTSGKILRTHVMRPTWHFVHPTDIKWLLTLTAPRVKSLMTYYNRILELDDALFNNSQTVLKNALEGEKALTRTELAHIFNEHGISGTGQRIGHILMTAELDGVICSGPRKGKQCTYMLLEERVPKAKEMDDEEALAHLTKRYFQSHGPATLKDFSWWSGLSMESVKRGIELVKSDVKKEEINNTVYYFYPSTPLPMNDTVYLLPNYDEYAIAYKDRTILSYPKYEETTRGAWTYPHLIVYEGKIIGLWKRVLKPKQIGIEPKFFEKPSTALVDAFKQSVEKYAAFLHLSLSQG